MPRSWRDHWPTTIADPNQRLLAEQEREAHVNRIGNLTLATKHLNPAMSNAAREIKRAELREHSKLHLTAHLVQQSTWDEACISARGRWLAAQLERIWPGPTDPIWNADPKASSAPL